MLRCTSLFSQVDFFDWAGGICETCPGVEGGARHQGVQCWGQWVGMLFCQLAQAQSLREICDGLRCCLGKLNHLGLKEAPHRSTLSYANAPNRPDLQDQLAFVPLDRWRASESSLWRTYASHG